MQKSFFIAGTDTEVGKTFVTAGLTLAIRRRNLSVGVLKPVQTGLGESAEPSDAEILASAAGYEGSLADISPYSFRESTSPHLAARLNNDRFDEGRVLGMHKNLTEAHEIVLVEGVGGLMVPLRDDYAVADLIQELGTPMILVTRASLGTLNHTLLTLRCCQDYNLEVVGIVVNVGAHGKGDLAERTNTEEIRRISGIPILGTVPSLANARLANGWPDIGRIADHVEAHLNMEHILGWEGV